jgi:hypothetical protein
MAAEPAVTTAPPEGGAAPPDGKPKGKGKTIAGLPAPVAIAGIIAFVVAGGWFLLHRGQAAGSSAAGDSTAGGAAGSPDDSAALSDIEQQLSDLNGTLGQLGGGASGGGSDGGGGVTGTTGDGGGTGTGTGTGGPPAKPPNPAAGIHWATVGGKGATRDLYQIAHDNGISEAELIRLNPQLKKYSGTKKPLPKRTRILV